MEFYKKIFVIILLVLIHCSQAIEIIIKNDTRRHIAKYELIVHEFEKGFKFFTSGKNLSADTSETKETGINSGLICIYLSFGVHK